MASKKAQDLKSGDAIKVSGKTYLVAGREINRDRTVVIVHVVDHSPYFFDYNQKVKTA